LKQKGSLILETGIPITPETAASNLAWQKLNMANPFSNTKLNYAYDVWDPAFASSYAPVNQAKNVIVGIRKKPDGTLDFTRCHGWIFDTGSF